MMVFVFGTMIAHFIRHPAHVLNKIFIYAKICCGCCGCCGSGRRASQRKRMLEDGRAGGKTKKKKGRADAKAAAFSSKPKLKVSEAISISSISADDDFFRMSLNGKRGTLAATAEEIALHEAFPQASRRDITVALADSGGNGNAAAALLVSQSNRQSSEERSARHGDKRVAKSRV